MAYTQEDRDTDAGIDAWHTGYFSHKTGGTCPHPPGFLADQWADGRRQWERDRHQVVALLPIRPEGYYHAPAGTYD